MMKRQRPQSPKWFSRWLTWFCRTELLEELQGDLEESFDRNCHQYGTRRARWIFRMEVLKLLRPSVIRRPGGKPIWMGALLANYAVISLRNLKRQSLFSFINVFSLSIAMSSGLLVIGMITDLLKFDEFHEHKHDIYRVISYPTYHLREQKPQATSPYQLADELQRDIGSIQVSRLGKRFGGEALVNGKKIQAKGIYADEHFFDFLTFHLTQGDPHTALKNPFQVVISESFATKTFQKQNPIGQVVQLEHLGDFIISGVVKDPPQFSHLQFEMIGSLSTTSLLANQGLIHPTHEAWENLDRYYTYLYVPDGRDKSAVIHWLENETSAFYQKPDQFTASFELQPIHQIVPGPNISDSIGPKMIYLPMIILSIIAAVILLTAIFNYTNLSMARALRRAREVGIRKLNGANKAAIMLQFTLEAMLLSLLSLGAGILIFMGLRDQFISVLPRAEEMVQLALSIELLLYFVAFAVITGLMAGLGPALFFARLTSLNALKSGHGIKSLSGIRLRKVLIGVQFTFSIIFVMAVVITRSQYSYAMNLDMGFARNNTLNISLQDHDPKLVKTELEKLPEVSSVTFTSYTPGIGIWNSIQVIHPGNQDTVWTHQISVGNEYLHQMNIPLVAGRKFQVGENDHLESSVLVNETFIRSFGFSNPSEAVGSRIEVAGKSVAIIGVTRDFIYANLEEHIKSLVIRNQGKFQVASVHLASDDIIGTLNKLEKAWTTIDAGKDFEAQFYDEQMADYYKFLVDFMKIFGFVGFLAISISSLGLLGMAIYSAETRMKEVGVRKTFGASEWSLAALLSKDFIKVVLWSILIGSPICYFLFDQLILSQNVYRIQITFTEIGISIVFLLAISLSTIFSQTFAAARRNPVSVLRDE